MKKILFYGLAFAYCHNILVNLFRLFQISKGIGKLDRFINAYESHHNSKQKYHSLLRYFPIIERYLELHHDTLNYDDADFSAHQKAVKIRNKLKESFNSQYHKFSGSFSPIAGFKTFVTFPVVILSWYRIRVSVKQGIMAAAIGYAINYLLGMFEPEIKSLLIALFEQFIRD